MTRKQALTAIKAAGSTGDTQAFVRLYVENRISYSVAREAYLEGQRFRAFIAKRDGATP